MSSRRPLVAFVERFLMDNAGQVVARFHRRGNGDQEDPWHGQVRGIEAANGSDEAIIDCPPAKTYEQLVFHLHECKPLSELLVPSSSRGDSVVVGELRTRLSRVGPWTPVIGFHQFARRIDAVGDRACFLLLHSGLSQANMVALSMACWRQS